METYEGILQIRLYNVGSKSEGYYPVLIPASRPDDESDRTEVVRLGRDGALPGDNSYFEPYDGQRVLLSGVMSRGWLIVAHIECLPQETEPREKRTNHEPDTNE